MVVIQLVAMVITNELSLLPVRLVFLAVKRQSPSATFKEVSVSVCTLNLIVKDSYAELCTVFGTDTMCN